MSQKSSVKTFFGATIMNENLALLEKIVEEEGGSVTLKLNDAIEEYLKNRGLTPVRFIDGRAGRWQKARDADGSDK